MARTALTPRLIERIMAVAVATTYRLTVREYSTNPIINPKREYHLTSPLLTIYKVAQASVNTHIHINIS